MPLVGSPIELIMPPSTSAARGGGLPARYSRETVFATMAPRRLMSITWARSVEKQPEPGMIGFCSVTDPILTLMSTIRPPPALPNPFGNRHCERSEAIQGPLAAKPGLLRRFAPRNDENLPSDRLLHVEHRAFDADPAQFLLAVDLEGADADVAGAEPACHHLLHRHLARNVVRLAEALHQLQQSVRAAGEERVGALLRDQPVENLFDVLHRARAVGVEHADHLAGFGEQRAGHDEILVARGQDRGDADAVLLRQLRDWAQRGDADAAAEHDDVAIARIEMKADAERADHVELVTRPERRQPARAAPDAFVQKLDAAARTVDAIDALRAAEEQFADVGRRAQEIEELPRIDGERLLLRLDHQVLVFGIDPGVGHHRAQRFLGRNRARLGRRRAFADDEGVGCKGFGCWHGSSMG